MLGDTELSDHCKGLYLGFRRRIFSDPHAPFHGRDFQLNTAPSLPHLDTGFPFGGLKCPPTGLDQFRA